MISSFGGLCLGAVKNNCFFESFFGREMVTMCVQFYLYIYPTLLLA